jgi:hypothetical protein
MTAGVRATFALSLEAILTGAPIAGESPRYHVDFAEGLQFAPGTSLEVEADLLYSATRTLAASTGEDLDLAGVLANAFGATFTAAEVMVLIIKAAPTNANSIKCGPAATNGFLGPHNAAADRIYIKPGEYQPFISKSGWGVFPGTADKYNVTNAAGGTGVTYTIHILARSQAVSG